MFLSVGSRGAATRIVSTARFAAVALLLPALPALADDPPPGVTQLLPRNRIAAIDDPVFVGAEEARIPDDAWVLGVALNGEAHAYSLNLLNHHEIVNDQAGDKPFAAVW